MVKIEKAKRKHIDAITDLERECFVEGWSREVVKTQITGLGKMFLVAVAPDGQIAGYVVMSHFLGEGHITNLAVATDWRRQGIGEQLMRAAINKAQVRFIGYIYLEVRVSNDAARRLYEKLGFEYTGTRPGYYTSPAEDAILMTLDLAKMMEEG